MNGLNVIMTVINILRFLHGGKPSKTVTLYEYCYNEEKDKYVLFNRVVSYYSKTFCLNPNNQNKSNDCYEISKKAFLNNEVCKQN